MFGLVPPAFAAAFVSIVLGAGTSCGGAQGNSNDAGAEGHPPLTHFCTGVEDFSAHGIALDAPYVTFQDEAGQGCVLRVGSPMADRGTCGDAGPSAVIEPNCPSTSVLFDVWGAPFLTPQLYVQSGYAFTRTDGQSQRNGRVLEMAIDSTAENLVTGHFRVEFQPFDSAPAALVVGTFGLCATTGSSIEPCRGM